MATVVVWMNQERTLRVVREPVIELDFEIAAKIDGALYAVERAPKMRDATGLPVWQIVTADSQGPGADILLGLVRLAIQCSPGKER